MIAARGKPEASTNPTLVHYFDANPAYKSQVNRGAKPLRLMCGSHAYHIQYTDELNKVTCGRCRRLVQKHLIELAGNLDQDYDKTQAS